ncbi:MAG: hypothetical protein F6K22_10765 [Okeania sp. SIO2F4]|nr:hypothetical protein [Okeania sp. SIO2F4]
MENHFYANNSPFNVYYSYVVRTLHATSLPPTLPLLGGVRSGSHTTPHLADIAFFLRNSIKLIIRSNPTLYFLLLRRCSNTFDIWYYTATRKVLMLKFITESLIINNY